MAGFLGHSGPQVDLHESPNRVHAVEDPQRQAEVNNGEPGPVAIKILFQSILKLWVYAKGRHHPQLRREREGGRKLLGEEGGAHSSGETDLEPVVPAILCIIILGLAEPGSQPRVFLSP